jgi:chromosome segregation ATPase
MIELERAKSTHGDSDDEAKRWADTIAETDLKRARYQEMAAADLIIFEELRARLAELDEMRSTAERELKALRNLQEHVNELEQERDALLDSLAEVTPEALDALTADERHQLYRLLRLKVTTSLEDGSLEASGAFTERPIFCQEETGYPRL